MMQVTKVWWDGDKLMAEPIDPATVYKDNEVAQPDSTCSETLRAQGKAYPRTCRKCGKGPCIADRVQPEQPEQEPVAWDGYNLDDMCEAFDRVIEEHHQRKNPFHDPVNKDAMIALRVLRGFVPYMKLYTNPPAAQRKPQYNKTEMNCFVQNLYDEKMREGKHGHYETMFHVVHRAIEAAHGIKENT
jgi:hypothetical protein